MAPIKFGPPRIVSSEDRKRPTPAIRLVPDDRRLAIVPASSHQQTETRPCFTSSWIEDVAPTQWDIAARYTVAGVEVVVALPPNSSNGVYIIDPPEYRLNPLHLQAMTETIDDIVESVPKDTDVRSLSTARPYIKSRAKDLLYSKLASKKDSKGNARELESQACYLAELLCKYTAGYGVLETLLLDGRVQDIYVDAPSSQTPVQVVLRSDTGGGVRQKCRTNVFVGRGDIQGFVSRIKFETGLPFSEAHPVLEADIRRLGARITLVGPPLSEKGIAIAIRKHTEGVWPLPSLIANGCLSPLLASFLWACVIGRRTVLVAGSRGAGKTTLLGSMMLEFPLSQRIILIEDTPEIPCRRMQDLGFDIQALRFSEAGGDKAGSAENSLRVSLRMGESAIVIGEVRGEEARVLYESMRAGSAGSAVLGTIHANSAEGVLDRAVEDLGVSERAFSSTDLVVVIGLIRSPDGTRFHRRIVEVVEVRATRTSTELVPLFSMSPGCSCAKPTDAFSAESKTIGGIARALGIAPKDILDIMKARAHADQLAAEALSDPASSIRIKGDDFRVMSNEFLTSCLFTESGAEAGLKEWKAWFDGHRSA